MWEDNDADDGDEDEDEEDEGLAGQLLSDLIASNKYGSAHSSCVSFLILSNSTCIISRLFLLLQMMIIMRMTRKMTQMR